MENLLIEILQSPRDSAIAAFESRLNSQEGSNEFLLLLRSNNSIAFTYMKTKMNEWASNPKRRELLNHKEIFYELVDSSSQQNFELYCGALENMSMCGIIWDGFIEYLTLKDSPRSLRVLNSIFKKFRSLNKSNELYTEIISSINKTSSLFTKHYLETNIPSKDPNLLEMFYSLVYQDIHPFFEDNSSAFFSSFVNLYKQIELQDILFEIYNLYIIKYPECIDMTQVLGSVLTGITTYDFKKYEILLNILKRKNIHAISKFKDIFIHAIQLGSVLSEKEKEEMANDTLEYTRNVIKHQDNYRGKVSEIMTHCKLVFGVEWVSKLIASGLDREMVIFFYLSLKIRDDSVIQECLRLVGSNTPDPYLSVMALRYLILMEEYHFIGVEILTSTHQGRYFGFYILKKYFDRQFGTKDFFLKAIDLVLDPPSLEVDPSYLLGPITEFIVNNREDEFSSGLLLSLYKYCYSFGSYTLPKTHLHMFFAYIKENVLFVNSILSYTHFFDVIGLIYLQDKSDDFILELVDTILKEDLVDLYNSTFFLLSLVALYSPKDLSGLIQIITIEKLWNTKELRHSMVCLTSSLYKKGYCSKEQLDYIISYLPKHQSYILLGNTLTNFALPKEEDLEERIILQTVLFKNNRLSRDEYLFSYQDAVSYFLNNFITKKNIRRVLRALNTGSKLLNSKEYLRDIVEKNYFSLNQGSIPTSVCVVFDI